MNRRTFFKVAATGVMAPIAAPMVVPITRVKWVLNEDAVKWVFDEDAAMKILEQMSETIVKSIVRQYDKKVDAGFGLS